MNFQSTLRISGGLAALAMLLASGSTSIAAQGSDSKAISALFLDARQHASLAANDAATLESYATSRVSSHSHGTRLNAMKEHVNDLGKVSKQLTDLSDQGSPWQQEAIKQVDPLLRGMADQLTTTINHLNGNQARRHFPEYREYVRANHDLASRTAELMSDIVEYDKANARARSLEQKFVLTPDKGE